MTATLLDANVLIAMVVTDHVHHTDAERWFHQFDDRFATSPIVQGSLVRLLVRSGEPVSAAIELLESATADERHEFWPDTVGYTDVDLSMVIGHRQVTDAYLAGLARHRSGRLATFDGGLAASHPDVVDLLPRRPS